MALEDLSFDDLVRVLLEDLSDTSRRKCSVGYLLRLVHGDERVPARVKDADVLAALTVAVEKGWMRYADGRPNLPELPSTDGTPFVTLTQAGGKRFVLTLLDVQSDQGAAIESETPFFVYRGPRRLFRGQGIVLDRRLLNARVINLVGTEKEFWLAPDDTLSLVFKD